MFPLKYIIEKIPETVHIPEIKSFGFLDCLKIVLLINVHTNHSAPQGGVVQG